MRGLKRAMLAMLFIGSGAANATLISSSVNDPFDFNWSYNTGSSVLTGFGSMNVSGFNSSMLVMTISLSNTSAVGGQGGERLTAFGFGIDSNATNVLFADFSDGGIVSGGLNPNFPGYQSVEVCLYGGSTCAGGGNGGIWAGTSDTFVLLLGGNWGSSVNVDPLALRYQTGYGAFDFSPTKVPEPGPLSLLGIGLVSLGLLRRRHAPAVATN